MTTPLPPTIVDCALISTERTFLQTCLSSWTNPLNASHPKGTCLTRLLALWNFQVLCQLPELLLSQPALKKCEGLVFQVGVLRGM